MSDKKKNWINDDEYPPVPDKMHCAFAENGKPVEIHVDNVENTIEFSHMIEMGVSTQMLSAALDVVGRLNSRLAIRADLEDVDVKMNLMSGFIKTKFSVHKCVMRDVLKTVCNEYGIEMIVHE